MDFHGTVTPLLSETMIDIPIDPRQDFGLVWTNRIECVGLYKWDSMGHYLT